MTTSTELMMNLEMKMRTTLLGVRTRFYDEYYISANVETSKPYSIASTVWRNRIASHPPRERTLSWRSRRGRRICHLRRSNGKEKAKTASSERHISQSAEYVWGGPYEIRGFWRECTLCRRSETEEEEAVNETHVERAGPWHTGKGKDNWTSHIAGQFTLPFDLYNNDAMS
jgi:hypothetical protein